MRYQRTDDKKCVVYIDGKWKTNPRKLELLMNAIKEQTSLIIPGDILRSEKASNLIQSAMIKISDLNEPVKAYFVHDENSNVGHYIFPDISSDSKKHMPLMTDFKKAESRNFYNKPVVIKEMHGFTKKSTLLARDSSYLTVISGDKKIPLLNFIKGARNSGYNSLLTSSMVNKKFAEVDKILDDLRVDLIGVAKNSDQLNQLNLFVVHVSDSLMN